MVASHYVIEKILEKWTDLRDLKNEFEKFSKRYPDDIEFQRIYNEFKDYLRINTERLERIRSELEVLEKNRKTEVSNTPL
ncbi:MAG: hypothetical protein B6U86_05175 [Candidatus Altiarchaeales archaeon ex4484_43]|nr:MAG: hypothetical protein B6U86_05175 [Candidatus Altiarchaeales archaeon ex4484_43]